MISSNESRRKRAVRACSIDAIVSPFHNIVVHLLANVAAPVYGGARRIARSRRTSSPSFDAARKLAYWLDAGIRIPGTELRFGFDPLLGLIPGIGDAAGAVLAGWILVEAYRLGASRATLVRIAGNIALDAGVGAVPLLGDIFDFVWKANLRNVALLERHLAEPGRAQRADRSFVLWVICGVLVTTLALLVLGILMMRWLFHALAAA